MGNTVSVSHNVSCVENKSGAIAIGRAPSHPIRDEAPCPGPQEQNEKVEILTPDDNGIPQFA